MSISRALADATTPSEEASSNTAMAASTSPSWNGNASFNRRSYTGKASLIRRSYKGKARVDKFSNTMREEKARFDR